MKVMESEEEWGGVVVAVWFVRFTNKEEEFDGVRAQGELRCESIQCMSSFIMECVCLCECVCVA